ncbi:MAG: hypothetical protein NHG36_15270 [Chromatiaceae bacterium]|nr:hypothetical protein [Candidatus Thioaporhodococcus sediminis]
MQTNSSPQSTPTKVKGQSKLLFTNYISCICGETPLFLTEPQTGLTNGLPAKTPKPEPVNHWQRAAQATDLQRDALIATGVDPAHLYGDLASGKREDRPGLASQPD